MGTVDAKRKRNLTPKLFSEFRVSSELFRSYAIAVAPKI